MIPTPPRQFSARTEKILDTVWAAMVHRVTRPLSKTAIELTESIARDTLFDSIEEDVRNALTPLMILAELDAESEVTP